MHFIRNFSLYRSIYFINGHLLRKNSCSRFISIHCGLHVNRTLLKQRGFKYHVPAYLFYISQEFQRQAHHHTNKGWKVDIKNSLETDAEQEHLQEKKPNCCEDGLEAIPHDVVISRLQQCSSVQEQINELCSLLSLTPEDIENRRKFCQSLSKLLRPYFPNMVLTQFGSGINGLGFKGCDIDVSLNITGEHGDPKTEPFVKGLTIPKVEEVDSGVVPLEMLKQLPPRLLLRFVRRVLRMHCSEIKGPVLLIKARCPIIRFYNEKHNLFCDMSCENSFSILNTKLLRLIGHLDDRVVTLLKVLRYWGKHGEFVGDMDMFNSYAFSLLVVYFMQNTVPPLLPSTNEIEEKSDFLRKYDVQDDLMYSDIKMFPPSKNTQTTAELLREFFFFYMHFDFEHVLCPRTSSSIPKWDYKLHCDSSGETFEVSTICTEDPFRSYFNTTSVATEKYCKAFLRNILAACQTYQNKDAWVQSSNNWGLNLILRKSETPIKIDQSYNFEIPLKSLISQRSHSSRQVWLQEISQAIIDAWEYSLLFQCTAMKNPTHIKGRNNSDESEAAFVCNPILKFHCKAYNVFSGRSNFKKLSLPENITNNPLEMERAISLEISKSKKNRQQEFFRFQCECVELQRKERSSLLVSLTFEKSNFRPAIGVFLREYMPRVMQHISQTQIDYDLNVADTISACNSER